MEAPKAKNGGRRAAGASIDRLLRNDFSTPGCGIPGHTKGEQNEGFRGCGSPFRDTLSTPVESSVEQRETPAYHRFFADRSTAATDVVGREIRCYARPSL